MAHHPYKLTAQAMLPDFDAERRYVLTEKEYANKELENLQGRWWPWFSYPQLGIFQHRDWQKYIHALDEYGAQLGKHEQEIQDGLIPLHFQVAHEGQQPDSQIQIELMVGNGAIHAKKKPPKRPARMDAAPDKANETHFSWPTPGGFARRNIHIGSHSIKVEFSKLKAHDNALLVNEVLYIKCGDDTKLGYSIQSHAVTHEQSGWVRFEG